MITYPSSVGLARIPTPLVSLERLSEALGVEILCKRDDLTGTLLSGNKVRKLEFLLAQAIDEGASGIITCGGTQSNHARASAIAAAQLGLKSHLILRCDTPDKPPELTGNTLLGRLAGASLHWVSSAEYSDIDTVFAKQMQRYEKEHGTRLFPIPEGGSNAVGVWGYIRCAEELAEQLGEEPATIIYPVGSGGTAAGLIAGCRLLNLPYRLVGFAVCDDRAHFQNRIAELLNEQSSQYRIDVTTDTEGIQVIDDYIGLGYAKASEDELRCIMDIVRQEGILLDPVYTGKAMFGLRQELQKGRSFGSRIVFLHTGGVFGNFAFSDAYQEICDSAG